MKRLQTTETLVRAIFWPVGLHCSLWLWGPPMSYSYYSYSPINMIEIYFSYTGWPIKNGTAYFPQYVDAITSISVWGNFWEQGDSRNVSRPVARILMEANIGHLPTKFGYNQMQGWKVINRYRILEVNFHILPHLTFDLLMWPLTPENITEANIGTY